MIELVVVLILVIYGLWLLKKDSGLAPAVNDNISSEQATSAGNTSTGSINVTNPTVPLSYAQTLQQYKSARIQLDQNCQATPNNVTHKNNTFIMIDNRASVARVVKIGSVFTVDAWGFKIVKLSSVTLPATWYVNCGSSQNVATILIQK